jgi:hypothetical protein
MLRPGWARVLGPADPNYFELRGVFGKIHSYIFRFYFGPLYFDNWLNEFFLDIRKFQKNLGVLFDLFMGPLHFFRFVLLASLYIWFVDFYYKMWIKHARVIILRISYSSLFMLIKWVFNKDKFFSNKILSFYPSLLFWNP